MSHRVTEEWMGEQVETLEDLLRSGLYAVCIGINPAPTSVTAGHYYQGRLGRQFCERLRRAGLLPRASGWEDDLAFDNGIGFTDIVKRATATASEVRPEEFAHGRGLLRAKMQAVQPRLVIFTFKKTAEVLFGPIAGMDASATVVWPARRSSSCQGRMRPAARSRAGSESCGSLSTIRIRGSRGLAAKVARTAPEAYWCQTCSHAERPMADRTIRLMVPTTLTKPAVSSPAARAAS